MLADMLDSQLNGLAWDGCVPAPSSGRILIASWRWGCSLHGREGFEEASWSSPAATKKQATWRYDNTGQPGIWPRQLNRKGNFREHAFCSLPGRLQVHTLARGAPQMPMVPLRQIFEAQNRACRKPFAICPRCIQSASRPHVKVGPPSPCLRTSLEMPTTSCYTIQPTDGAP